LTVIYLLLRLSLARKVFPLDFLLFTHLFRFFAKPRLHFAAVFFTAFFETAGEGAGKFPAPLNVALAGVANDGGAGGTP